MIGSRRLFSPGAHVPPRPAGQTRPALRAPALSVFAPAGDARCSEGPGSYAIVAHPETTVQSGRYNEHVHLTASAPTRIDLAGGTIDIWPLYLFHDGAQTLNVAISLRAHVSLDARADRRLVVESVDTGHRLEADSWSELDLQGELSLVARLLRFFQASGLNVTTRCQSPAGAGIAGSSALNIALCGALNRWQGRGFSDDVLLEVAMNVEAQAIKVPTGVQDYRPALYGGIAAVELSPAGVRRVALDVAPHEIEQRVVLAYTGAPRASGTNNWEITRRHLDGDRRIFDCFERIRDTAAAMREALERGRWDEVGRQIAAEWANRKALAPGVSTPAIEDLMARARAAGAVAAKVCGAGGGGCLFCYSEPRDVPAVRAALIEGGAQLLEFRVETEGLRVG